MTLDYLLNASTREVTDYLCRHQPSREVMRAFIARDPDKWVSVGVAMIYRGVSQDRIDWMIDSTETVH